MDERKDTTFYSPWVQVDFKTKQRLHQELSKHAAIKYTSNRALSSLSHKYLMDDLVATCPINCIILQVAVTQVKALPPLFVTIAL